MTIEFDAAVFRTANAPLTIEKVSAPRLRRLATYSCGCRRVGCATATCM